METVINPISFYLKPRIMEVLAILTVPLATRGFDKERNLRDTI